ncbi:MAG: hypothetical protein A2X49_12070 [Lentisphaerae bacterium GWF2_52_8]|nr:MAG: hypothetical protein A2X49_12070 [Lentisphaerae bacterium GWF2_52_8]
MKDNFHETVFKITRSDSRYAPDAYSFVSEAVTYTAKNLMRHRNSENRHISGQEMLKGFAEYALQQYGPMAATVLRNWGLNNARDVGCVVFNMVNEKLLRASKNDSLDDFNEGLDFTEVFERPFAARDCAQKLTPPIIA